MRIPLKILGRSKYGNMRTKIDGITFDSKREASRYTVLKWMLRTNVISKLVVHKLYPLVVNGVKVCSYEADFVYVENGVTVVEDVKGVRTAVYKIKKKLMKAIHGIDITEVK